MSFEDQKLINAFSRLNNRRSDAEDDLKKQEREKEALEEVSLELELVDEDEEVL